MWAFNCFILLLLSLESCFIEVESKPQFPMDNVDALPPLPPTDNNWRLKQSNLPPLPGTVDTQFSQFNSQSNSNWPNKPSWPVRQQIAQREQKNQMDTLNDGMQREVWNNWMPDKNYGIRVGSRPDFGRGGWMARRTLDAQTGQQQ